MPDFNAKMHQDRFRLGLRPRPRWGGPPPQTPLGELTALSQASQLDLRGPTSKGRGREGREGRGGEGRVGKGGEGKGARPVCIVLTILATGLQFAVDSIWAVKSQTLLVVFITGAVERC